ncbi:MAG: hypothetical protein HOP18_04205 [Deltaproteobacteria bacterium]|nr:hypothetical protein [Deltaproteobacteria bacterium]
MTEPFMCGPNFSVISAMGMDGLCASFLIGGVINADIFTRYVEQFLVPCLRLGQQVWMDNVKFHSAPKAVAAIAATGARACYLPNYSPDFNPMEQGISKIKEYPRGQSPDPRDLDDRPRRSPQRRHDERHMRLVCPLRLCRLTQMKTAVA